MAKRPTLAEIAAMEGDCLTPEEVSGVLGCTPYSISVMAETADGRDADEDPAQGVPGLHGLAGGAGMTEVPHGQRRCEDCEFYHPERLRKRCSAFGDPENKQADCSLYITVGAQDKRIRLLQAQRNIQQELLKMDGRDKG